MTRLCGGINKAKISQKNRTSLQNENETFFVSKLFRISFIRTTKNTFVSGKPFQPSEMLYQENNELKFVDFGKNYWINYRKELALSPSLIKRYFKMVPSLVEKI